MIEVLDSTEAVIDALGGNGPVATIARRKPGAVSNWRNFKTFPPDTYLAMTAALESKGKSAPAALWRMVEPGQGETVAEREGGAA